MSDFQKITDAIRTFLVAGDRSWNNELPDLAANYAAACREANDRMRRCAEYLRRGMRSEAVHLVDCQPNLIEMAAALRFAEAADWAQVCAANSLTIAPPLVEDRAEDIEEARELEADLGPLLSQHRILSLAKSPLLERIEILSALAERDSENPCWRQEIKLLEIARLEEIRDAAIAAVKASDSGRISELLESLDDRSWQGPVPKDLRDELQRALDEAAAVENTAVAGKLVEELIAACEGGDLDLAMQLQTQWNDLARVIPPAARDQLRETLDPAIAWIDAENQARNPQVEAEPAAAPSIVGGYGSSFGTLEAWRHRFSPLVLKCLAVGVALTAIAAYLAMHFSARHR